MKPQRRYKGVLKALNVLKIWSSLDDKNYLQDFKEKKTWTMRLIQTRCKCSKSCCGNPRKSGVGSNNDRITIQERKSDISFKEQLDERENNELK